MDMSRSATAGHLPHTALELRRAEATTSASQLRAAAVEHFPENHGKIERLACQVVSVTIPAQTLMLKRT
jgi:hypothetical protein